MSDVKWILVIKSEIDMCKYAWLINLYAEWLFK